MFVKCDGGLFLAFFEKKKKIRVNIVTIYEKKLRLISVVTKQNKKLLLLKRLNKQD